MQVDVVLIDPYSIDGKRFSVGAQPIWSIIWSIEVFLHLNVSYGSTGKLSLMIVIKLVLICVTVQKCLKSLRVSIGLPRSAFGKLDIAIRAGL